MKTPFISLLFSLMTLGALAAEVTANITLQSNRELPIYHCGEKAEFILTVKNGNALLNQGTVSLQLVQSRALPPQTIQIDLSKANPAVIHGSMQSPGFLVAKVTKWSGFACASKLKPQAGAGFDVEKITPGFSAPPDLNAFWENTRKEIAKNPVTLTKLPKLCTQKYDYFLVTVHSVNQDKNYGFLLLPKGVKKCPILIEFPGAGPGVLQVPGTYAEKGVIHLYMNVHKYPPASTAAERKKLYDAYNKKVGRTYCFEGLQNKDSFFFRAILASADKMVNYLTNLPQWDGRHLVVSGQSQGGGLSLLLAGINPRVTAVRAFIPALCDHGAVKASRDPGWPKLHYMYLVNPNVMEKTAAYYDAALLAGNIRVPTLILYGLIDSTCPPSSVFAAYNRLKGEKQIICMPMSGHDVPPKYRASAQKWLEQALFR